MVERMDGGEAVLEALRNLDVAYKSLAHVEQACG